MTRRRFSEREILETLAIQGIVLHCYRCGKPMEGKDAQREHLAEFALGGEDRPQNCVYSHSWCHRIVTDGTKATTAGSSKQRIAKVRRLIHGKKRRGRKIPSRPFDKRK